MFISSEDSTPSFKGFTLILPAVCVGNVGQLSADLIISTLGLIRVGHFHTDCLIPMLGNNPYSPAGEPEQLCTNADVYSDSDLKLTVLQIRSPIIQTKVKSFRKLLVSWIKSSGFSRTVLLSSSHAYQRDDQQLNGLSLRYLVSPALQDEELRFRDLGWTELERLRAVAGLSESETRLYIPGGGVTKGLYTDCCSEKLPLAVLLLFCSEGDNIPDALTLTNHLNDWLHLLDKPAQGLISWKIPSSWQLLFGGGFPPLIF